MRHTADYWIRHLQLEPHPEGGAFRQTYRAALTVRKDALPPGFAGDCSAATQIYFLIRNGEYSAFHRIQSDEIWHFYAGDTLLVHEIGEDGTLHTHTLGAEPERGESFQSVVGARSWFASELKDGGEYALVGCTVAPGFDFADFELAKKDTLARAFPAHIGLISRLSHD
ncbi:cupin domain-containing protein [Pendulispora rubella]|uniref:Cupin domain-containing protein n=1 Tax=Pendulispora rubella TaxID=2741070 RepID=A0ABZ2LG92_9BACT